MKTIPNPLLLTALLLLAPASSHAASIGVSFLGDTDVGTVQRWVLAPANSAGVVVQSNWNNVATTANLDVGTSDLLVDHAGTYTAVRLRYAGNDAWNSDGPYATPNDKLMKGTFKEGNGVVDTTMTLSFTNLPAASYDVYVYGTVNDGPVDLDVSIGVATNYWTEPAAFDDVSGFIQASSSDANNRAAGNYSKFTGVTPVAGTITIVATYRAGSDGLGIAGLQLVTAGSFPSNTIPVSILQPPQPALGAPNGTATFLVWAGGPGPRYQWFKNGTLIAGATASSYTTPTLHTPDNGSRFKVTVQNNVNSITSPEVLLTVVTDPGTRVASLGASFLGNSPDQNVEPWRLGRTDAAGVLLPTTASGNTGISEPLLDKANHFTGVQLEFVADDAWNSDGTIDTPNEKMMKGLLKESEGSSLALTFTNLANGFYDVYVYGNVNFGPADLDVSIEPATNYWTEPASFDDVTGFIQASSSNPNNRAAGNYAKFASVTPASGTITILATYQGGSDGLGIAGAQLASSVAFPTNTAPVIIVGQPRAVIAAPGTAATFIVWSKGPFPSYQWVRNGTVLPGATGSSYTTPPVNPSDNGAQYRVGVANDVNSVTSAVVVLTVTNDPGVRVASMGMSFLGIADIGSVDAWRLAPTDVAGVIAQTNWSNLQWDVWGSPNPPATGFVGLSSPLPDNASNLTAVQLIANSNDAWNSDGPVDTPNAKLMKGILKQGDMGTSMTLTVTNLWAAFYDVYVFGAVNDGPAFLDVSIAGTTNYWLEPAAYDNGTGFIEAASHDPAAPAAGNYVRFTGVTPASGQITVIATYQGGSDGLGIAGLQLVSSVPFPAAGTLTPRLNAAVQSNQITLSWKSPATFQLQSRASLTAGNWTDEPTPPLVVLDQATVLLPAAGPPRYFRLLGY
jgi:hypothetical protein